MDCIKCGTELQPGKAILQTTVGGSPDMGEVMTLSAGGPGKLVDCLKCPSCGHSMSHPTPTGEK